MDATKANEYTMNIDAATVSRFLLAVGIGLPARRDSCLLELHQHIIRTFGDNQRTRRITHNLMLKVRDLYHWKAETGQTITRCVTV
ncbi:hypothetical protein SEA_ABT2GRADUATEX2_14 [Streptomyces phage Abt2graduatex2]|nr:hypothetical protein SEA_ABT2GRADUATEX2_14 [Streptomyces phage Abt2graduatex2]